MVHASIWPTCMQITRRSGITRHDHRPQEESVPRILARSWSNNGVLYPSPYSIQLQARVVRYCAGGKRAITPNLGTTDSINMTRCSVQSLAHSFADFFIIVVRLIPQLNLPGSSSSRPPIFPCSSINPSQLHPQGHGEHHVSHDARV